MLSLLQTQTCSMESTRPSRLQRRSCRPPVEFLDRLSKSPNALGTPVNVPEPKQKQARFEVLPPGHPEADLVRRTFSARMSRLYSGWSDDYDRRFDANSFIFVLRSPDGTGYSATCRVIFKSLAGRVLDTPSETGDLDRYVLPVTSRTCCEGSMVSFVTPQDLRTLMYGVTLWAMANGVEVMFTSHDVDNPLTRRFFTRTLGFKPIEGAVVRYGSFLVTATGQPAAWQVVRVNPIEEGPSILRRLVEAGVAPYELPDGMPGLADWM